MHQRGIRPGSLGSTTERETCTVNRALMNYAFPSTTKSLTESYFSTTKLDHAWLRVENRFILILNNHGSTLKYHLLLIQFNDRSWLTPGSKDVGCPVGCFLSIAVGRIRL